MTSPPLPRAPRIEVRVSAEVKIDGSSVSGTTRNLSPGGVCLELDRPIAENSFVRLTLLLVEDDVEAEGARGLDLTGTVQWTAEADRGHAVGIKFGNLSAAQAASLEQAIRIAGG